MINREQVESYLISSKGQLLAMVLAVIFLGLSILVLFQAFELFFSQPQFNKTKNPTLVSNQKTTLSKETLSDLHLFGIYIPKSDDLNNLPESQLNLDLEGVFVSVPENLSQAVLSVPGGAQKVYYVGDKIPGNAKLYRVLPDKVIILHNGQLQTLLLPEKSLKFSPLSESIRFPTTIREPHRSLP